MLTEIRLSINRRDPGVAGVEAAGYQCLRTLCSWLIKGLRCVRYGCFFLSPPQGGLCVLAMQSVFEESLPRPSGDAIRGEMMPSCWVLQPVKHGGREVTRVIYLLQVRFAYCDHALCSKNTS